MDCIKAYNKKAVLDRKTVLVVTSDPPLYSSNSILAVDDFVGNEVGDQTWSWMCPDPDGYYYKDCDLASVLDGSEPWSPFLQILL